MSGSSFGSKLNSYAPMLAFSERQLFSVSKVGSRF